jgi:Skp family chaperone for outer membrane proteins
MLKTINISKNKLIWLSLILGICAADTSMAADKDSNSNAGKIAVVDMNKIKSDSSAIKMIVEKLEKHRASFQSEINKQEGKLREQEKALEAAQSKTPEAEFEKKRKDFQEQVIKLQKTVMERKASLEKAHDTAVSKVNEEMMKIISEIASKKGYMGAQPSSLFLYFDKTLEITDDVLTQLNKTLPSVDVKLEKVTISESSLAQ